MMSPYEKEVINQQKRNTGDQVLKELVDVNDKLVLEDNETEVDVEQHLQMIALIDQLIVLRYRYVFAHQNSGDTIDNVNFKLRPK